MSTPVPALVLPVLEANHGAFWCWLWVYNSKQKKPTHGHVFFALVPGCFL